MKHKLLLIAGVATFSLLAACTAKSDTQTKRQPGSWTSKVEIVKLEGKDIKPGAKEALQQMFTMMSSASVCVTPEAVAKESIDKNLENAGGAGSNCVFDKRNFSGDALEFSGTCGTAARKVRLTAKGTSSTTAQDILMTVEPLNAGGGAEGMMQMRLTTTRGGECKPGDLRPRPPSARPRAQRLGQDDRPAYANYRGGTEAERRLGATLRAAMVKQGFEINPTE